MSSCCRALGGGLVAGPGAYHEARVALPAEAPVQPTRVGSLSRHLSPWLPVTANLELKLRFPLRDLLHAWLMATIFSGLPSTLHALSKGSDPLEATRAAGAMLLPADSALAALLAAATVAHGCVSLFWAGIFGLLLPPRRVLLWSVAAAAAVALLDLQVIAPLLFPTVAALPFWPQFADHLMWGALLGGTLQYRQWCRSVPRQRS
jgi:hypothetical protein